MTDVPVGFKRCSRGGECASPMGCIQPATEEYFYKDKRMPDGYKKRCRECVKSAERNSYSLNIDAERARNRAWRATNPSKVKARNISWRAAYPERARSIARISSLRRRTVEHSLPISFTRLDWKCTLDYFEHRCAYCLDPPEQGSVLEADHFIPLASRKCPGTVPENMVPACRRCNASKGRKHPKRWLTERFGPFYALITLRRIRDYFEWLKSQDEGAP